MIIKLYDRTIDTRQIKKLHNDIKRLYDMKLKKNIKVKYCVEMVDDNFVIVDKQEYKLLSRVINNE